MFAYKLERPDGAPAEPPTLRSTTPTWGPGDVIHLGPGRTLRVTGTRPAGSPAEDLPVLVVEKV